jgi:hypothetical protein
MLNKPSGVLVLADAVVSEAHGCAVGQLALLRSLLRLHQQVGRLRAVGAHRNLISQLQLDCHRLYYPFITLDFSLCGPSLLVLISKAVRFLAAFRVLMAMRYLHNLSFTREV